MFKVVTNLEDLIKVFVVRGIVFIEEQGVPYNIEHDVHDSTATHILGEKNGEPFGAGRIRAIGEYAKLERIAIRKSYRGKGLGHKFLRHIERTKALVHCISAEVEDPLEAYRVVRKELELYNKEIIKKTEVIVLTKTDLVSTDEMEKKMAILKKVSDTVFPVSILDDKLVKKFGDYLTKTFKS